MRSTLRALRQRVLKSRYAVDNRAVAHAIVARAKVSEPGDRPDVREQLGRVGEEITQFRSAAADPAAPAPARSLRRATARRASSRRATARSRQDDTSAGIIEFITRHPGSTAGDLAKGLNLNPARVSMRLKQLAKTGEITKQSRGYSCP